MTEGAHAIDALLLEERRYPPPEEFAAQAAIVIEGPVGRSRAADSASRIATAAATCLQNEQLHTAWRPSEDVVTCVVR